VKQIEKHNARLAKKLAPVEPSVSPPVPPPLSGDEEKLLLEMLALIKRGGRDYFVMVEDPGGTLLSFYTDGGAKKARKTLRNK
jgi:hypothetical protein